MRKIGLVCLTPNNAIGFRNKLIYNIPSELNHFKKTTTAVKYKKIPNLLVMGRKTFDSINCKPLPNRVNCVISSNYKQFQNQYTYNNLKFFPSIDTFLDYTNKFHHSYNNLYVCGGKSIYEYFINKNLFDSLIVTQITDSNNSIGDTFFPPFDDKYSCVKTETFNDKPATLVSTNKKQFIDYSINTYIPTYKNVNRNTTSVNRNTTSVIDTSLQEYNYLDALKDVLNTGTMRKSRNSNTISKFGINMSFDISKNIPLLTTKNVYWKGVIHELLWFINANTNAKDLSKNKVKIWDGNSTREFLDKRGLNHYEEGDCGPIYGFQWRHFNAEYSSYDNNYSGKGVDQLQQIIDLINNDPSSRRMIMSAWNPCQLDEMCLPPCHVLYQFYVDIDSDGKKYLSCSMYQRSGDMFLGIPFNIASTSALTYLIAHHTGCIPKNINITVGDAHIYEEHIQAVNTQLERSPTTPPNLRITCKPKVNINDYTINDFELENYNPASPIKAPMIA